MFAAAWRKRAAQARPRHRRRARRPLGPGPPGRRAAAGGCGAAGRLGARGRRRPSGTDPACGAPGALQATWMTQHQPRRRGVGTQGRGAPPPPRARGGRASRRGSIVCRARAGGVHSGAAVGRRARAGLRPREGKGGAGREEQPRDGGGVGRPPAGSAAPSSTRPTWTRREDRVERAAAHPPPGRRGGLGPLPAPCRPAHAPHPTPTRTPGLRGAAPTPRIAASPRPPPLQE